MKKHTAVTAAIGLTGLLVASAGTAIAGHEGFTDGPFGAHEAGVHFVADAGITAGCNAEGTRYCPGDTVSRAQMGTFMHRLSGKGSAAPSVNAAELSGLSAGEILGTGGAEPRVNAAALDGYTIEDLADLLVDQYYVLRAEYTGGVGGAFCRPGDIAISGSFLQLGEIMLVEGSFNYFDQETQEDGWLFAFQDGAGNNVGEGGVSVMCQQTASNRSSMTTQSSGTGETRSAARLKEMLEDGPTMAKPGE